MCFYFDTYRYYKNYLKHNILYTIFICYMCVCTVSNVNTSENEISTPTTPTVAIQIAAEEGRLRKVFNEAVDSSENLDLKSESSSHTPINYPVGKPLEVKNLF